MSCCHVCFQVQLAPLQQVLVDEIDWLLNEKGYSPDDIFVLSPTVKGAKLNSKTPLAQLENTLVMLHNVPVYVSVSDEAGGASRTSARPTLNVLLPLAHSVCESVHPEVKFSHAGTVPISVECLLSMTLL
jgi:hypothetical protein